MYYYDERQGRERLKRRYAWAAWSFGAGFLLGFLISQLF